MPSPLAAPSLELWAVVSPAPVVEALTSTKPLCLDVPLYSRLYLDGRIKLDELLSERIDLDGVNNALATLDGFAGARSVIGFPAPKGVA